MNNIISEIRAFILKCPYLDGNIVNVNYIGAQMSYSVDPLPCDPVLKKYVDGGAIKQYQFAFTSKEEYDEDARANIESSGFYEHFEEWLELQSHEGLSVDLGSKKTAVRFETLNKGYLYDVDGKDARYRIECRLVYRQEV